MAVYVYGVTNTDVYPYISFGTSSIGANSKVTPTMITGWIEDASGEITGALGNAGVANESLTDDQLAAVRRAIASYAAAKSYQSIGWETSGQTAIKEYDNLIALYRATPRALGATGSTTRSNVNTSNPRARRFPTNYQW